MPLPIVGVKVFLQAAYREQANQCTTSPWVCKRQKQYLSRFRTFTFFFIYYFCLSHTCFLGDTWIQPRGMTMSPRSVFTEMSLVSWYKTLVVSHVDNAIYAKLFYEPDFTLFKHIHAWKTSLMQSHFNLTLNIIPIRPAGNLGFNYYWKYSVSQRSLDIEGINTC